MSIFNKVNYKILNKVNYNCLYWNLYKHTKCIIINHSCHLPATKMVDSKLSLNHFYLELCFMYILRKRAGSLSKHKLVICLCQSDCSLLHKYIMKQSEGSRRQSSHSLTYLKESSSRTTASLSDLLANVIEICQVRVCHLTGVILEQGHPPYTVSGHCTSLHTQTHKQTNEEGYILQD